MLAHFLREVSAEATVRLRSMSDGRFGFVVSDQDEKGRAVGLRLDIEDSYTGKKRPANPVSGGERSEERPVWKECRARGPPHV